MTARPALLDRLLERLYASLASGPVLNCRPHRSRQRLDFVGLCEWAGVAPHEALGQLLGAAREVVLTPAALPRDATMAQRWEQEERLAPTLKRVRTIVDDARSYAQDTGAHALFVGYPILHLPPAANARAGAKRLFAPLCFVAVEVSVKATRTPSITLSCREDGADHVVANEALAAWVEQSTGQRLALGDIPDDTPAWEEIRRVVDLFAGAFGLVPPPLNPDLALAPAPKPDDADGDAAGGATPAILASAVLGLYPLAYQGLLSDLRDMQREPPTEGPVTRFLRADAAAREGEAALARYSPADERLVMRADPCQARAVRYARSATGLVVHGPPGTGKSQTIANMIGDHLARGQRVLFVCEKRTALDVVQHRLAHLGLGSLCAVVHDPTRDQRDLYRSVRDQLDGLAEQTLEEPAGQRALEALDAELVQLHQELTGAHTAVHGGGAASYHEQVGEWLSLQVSPVLARDPVLQTIAAVAPAEVTQHDRVLREVLERAAAASIPEHEWATATQLTLADYLAEPSATWVARLDDTHSEAVRVDGVPAPESLPFRAQPHGALESPVEEAALRATLIPDLEQVLAALPGDTIASWAAHADAQILATGETALAQVAQEVLVLERPDDAVDLALLVRDAPPPMVELLQWLSALQGWAAVAPRWWSFAYVSRRRAAQRVVERFGLALESYERVLSFLTRERAGRLVRELLANNLHDARALATHADAAKALRGYEALIRLLRAARSVAGVIGALADVERHRELLEDLRCSPARADAIDRAELALNTPLFAPAFRRDLGVALRRGVAVGARLAALRSHVEALDGTVRLLDRLASLPDALQPLVMRIAALGGTPDEGVCALRAGTLVHAVTQRLRSDPALASLDDAWFRSRAERWHQVQAEKRAAVQHLVRRQWLTRQRERLLAGTGSRLGPQGTDLRRRLLLRGERALRLRQVIALGPENRSSDGDPLFDLRPVWMASPETVAQIFPRAPLFDVVIFDEASQCRLEHALPVLTRAPRVVIAGDPQQLPPSRFFESAAARTDEVDSDLDEQGLFERQQADVEDLLTAALNLELESAHLDVHYRSRNPELIAFSNRWFYNERLQTIPGQPGQRLLPAVHSTRVEGAVYEKGVNPAEAQAVVGVVRELLAREPTPSVGVACMNRAQQELILDALESAAEADAVFAQRLETARRRQGEASFEGLFVKNLENVQGDERDHLVISTTYGPDPKGRFYKRFGPLALPGGGRRLNVLVTRAREAIHLVTSVPRSELSALPPIPDGEQPNGAYLLFAYLRWAEALSEGATTAQLGAVAPAGRATLLTRVVAARLAERGLVTQTALGNEGFCVDVAAGPTPAEPAGILCDGTRYAKADDAVEWELFRTRALEEQGWRLTRVCAPQLVHDAQAALTRLESHARRAR